MIYASDSTEVISLGMASFPHKQQPNVRGSIKMWPIARVYDTCGSNILCSMVRIHNGSPSDACVDVPGNVKSTTNQRRPFSSVPWISENKTCCFFLCHMRRRGHRPWMTDLTQEHHGSTKYKFGFIPEDHTGERICFYVPDCSGWESMKAFYHTATVYIKS